MSKVISRTVAVLCLNSEGSPEFHFSTLSITPRQLAEGDHYDLAKADAAEQGYTSPMIAFDEDDEAVRQWPVLMAHFGFAGAFEDRPRCLVIVSGGIADPVSDPGVDVEVFDWDNYLVETPSGQQAMRLPSNFKDLAEPVGVPVETT